MDQSVLNHPSENDAAGDRSNVRFKDSVETYKAQPEMPVKDLKTAQAEAELEEMTPEAREEIRRLAMSQQKSRLQEQRTSHFAYDTFSLPASRVCIPPLSRIYGLQLNIRLGSISR